MLLSLFSFRSQCHFLSLYFFLKQMKTLKGVWSRLYTFGKIMKQVSSRRITLFFPIFFFFGLCSLLFILLIWNQWFFFTTSHCIHKINNGVFPFLSLCTIILKPWFTLHNCNKLREPFPVKDEAKIQFWEKSTFVKVWELTYMPCLPYIFCQHHVVMLWKKFFWQLQSWPLSIAALNFMNTHKYSEILIETKISLKCLNFFAYWYSVFASFHLFFSDLKAYTL